MLVLPETGPGTQWLVRMHWNLPAKWSLATSFGSRRDQSFQASSNDLREALFLGGDYNVHEEPLGSGAITIAMRGSEWQFSPMQFDAIVTKIVDVERKFWEPRTNHSGFLIALEPTGDEVGYFHGMGRTNGFGLWLPHTTGLSTYLKTTIAHEMMHNYTPGPLTNLDPPQWFCEGFTDYFAAQICLQERLISFSEYVGLFNDRWRHYYRSKVRNLTENEESKHRFDSNDNFNLPYWRGMLLAANWDSRIRSASNGRHTLAEAVKLAMARARAGHTSSGTSCIASAVRAIYSPGIDSDIEKYIVHGETMTPDSGALGSEVDLTWLPNQPNLPSAPQFTLKQPIDHR